MTLSRLILIPVGLCALLLGSCTTNTGSDNFDYLRSPVTFRIDPVDDNHAFCNSAATRGAFATQAECQATRKYRLRWESPEDTIGFSEYRIYVDTTPPNAPAQTWPTVQKDSTFAAVLMPGAASSVDSLIFVLGSGNGAPQSVSRTSPHIIRIDTTGRTDSTGRLVFAITTRYAKSGIDGQPRYTWVITNDRFSPYPLQPLYKPKARSVDISWSRPGDPTSFFDPGADSGFIKGYYLRVVRSVIADTAIHFNPQVTSFKANNVDRTSLVTSTSFTTVKGFAGRLFWFPDSQHVFNRLGEDPRDSLRATVEGLAPQDKVDFTLWAVDLAGNTTESGISNQISLTDTTQPTTPQVQLVSGSVTRNGFAYTFTASRDLYETGSGLAPAPNPNANILEYRINRRRTDSTGFISSVDSTFTVPASLRGVGLFTDTVRYLPPGASYHLSVYAVDSTGNTSNEGSIDVSTPAVTFTGSDTLATCPTGFIPIPAGRFQMGSTVNTDESPNSTAPDGKRGIGSYCIEPYEHRTGTTSGPFQTKVTWEQARDVCAAISPSNGTHLCTEAEWERACEGTSSTPLIYGIQSELRDPQNVRYACNIGTNDSAMANNINLRDPTCLSYDGVFDMSGNFAEWVLDPYTSTGYPSGDTAIVGQPLTPTTSSTRRGFRGTSYLNTGRTPAIMQSSGRCSNRDFPEQSRPLPYAGCTSASSPKLVVTYGTKPPRCFDLPDSLKNKSGLTAQPGRDTNQIFILVPKQTNPVVFTMPLDTNYRQQRPATALMTPLALAVVTFVNSQTSESVVDTLDANELLQASSAGLAAIFTREASPPWSVKQVNGQYQIQYLYSYSTSQVIPARQYYSNKVIGFRCCSNPVPASLGKRRLLLKK